MPYRGLQTTSLLLLIERAPQIVLAVLCKDNPMPTPCRQVDPHVEKEMQKSKNVIEQEKAYRSWRKPLKYLFREFSKS